MKNSLNITAYLIQILSSNSELKALLTDEKSGLRIYPIDAIKGTLFPFCVIQRTSVTPYYSKDGNYRDDVDVTIVVVSPKYTEAVSVAGLIRDTLEYKKYSDTNIKLKSITLSSVVESIVNDSFVQQLDFKIIL